MKARQLSMFTDKEVRRDIMLFHNPPKWFITMVRTSKMLPIGNRMPLNVHRLPLHEVTPMRDIQMPLLREKSFHYVG